MKDVDTLKGLHGIKTLASTKRRSISHTQASPYIDMYMMDKEKERLEKELLRVEMRYKQIMERLQEIGRTREKIHLDAVRSDVVKTDEDSKSKPKDWKKMSMKY
ncbi:MAG: hypothetical protein PHV82_05230 [Victivallaceae bacterium]|nr:hypothetical protein [Victivallaceae bacterium]